MAKRIHLRGSGAQSASLQLKVEAISLDWRKTVPEEVMLEHTDRVALFDAWDEMDRAAQRIQTAQAADITAAAERLEAARLKMRDALHKAINF